MKKIFIISLICLLSFGCYSPDEKNNKRQFEPVMYKGTAFQIKIVEPRMDQEYIPVSTYQQELEKHENK